MTEDAASIAASLRAVPDGVKRSPDLATLDHVHPKSFGGPLSRDNIVLACSACNNERGVMEASAFRVLKAAGKPA
ncbi:HNH endonuclease [Microvirga aerilata]|uniref:HNH endonuclease n=1 Tax=Microvirga aerilata TaxID=670292 RepID=UPI003625A1D2